MIKSIHNTTRSIKNILIYKWRRMTFVVAASNSLYPENADFICDGVNDQVQIQAAIDGLSMIGGK